jgi:hypothetical protein
VICREQFVDAATREGLTVSAAVELWDALPPTWRAAATVSDATDALRSYVNDLLASRAESDDTRHHVPSPS